MNDSNVLLGDHDFIGNNHVLKKLMDDPNTIDRIVQAREKNEVKSEPIGCCGTVGSTKKLKSSRKSRTVKSRSKSKRKTKSRSKSKRKTKSKSKSRSKRKTFKTPRKSKSKSKKIPPMDQTALLDKEYHLDVGKQKHKKKVTLDKKVKINPDKLRSIGKTFCVKERKATNNLPDSGSLMVYKGLTNKTKRYGLKTVCSSCNNNKFTFINEKTANGLN